MFGKYIFVDDKSDKFWTCIPSAKYPGSYYTEWGPNGTGRIGSKDGLTRTEAEKKVSEKVAKGYRFAAKSKPVTKCLTKSASSFAEIFKTQQQTPDANFWKEFYAEKPKLPTEPSVDAVVASAVASVVSAEEVVELTEAPTGKEEIIHPSRCTAILPDDLTKPYLVAEPKLDGSRYVLYLGHDPYNRHAGHTLLSRRTSTVDGKLVDRTANVPHITSVEYPGFDFTVIDGEIQSDDFAGTNSIMNSAPKVAIQKQEIAGKLKYHVWDIMIYRGQDIRGLPLEQRRKVLETVVELLDNPYITCVPQKTGDLQTYFNEIVAAGGEGIVVKDIRQSYGCGWAKYKKAYDVSCVITGWKPGNGKYATQVGSLAISVFSGDKLVEIGFASGFDDKMRLELSVNFEKYRNTVIDVFAQEISKPSEDHVHGRLRHPTFHRLRSDLNPEDCTFTKLTEDLKKKITRSRRKDEE